MADQLYPLQARASIKASTSRTEGWAAGLQLAALSLRGQADPAGFVAGFSGSHRHVLDYLAGEVLDQQPEEVRTFLLETSVLERLSGPLCNAVTGRTGGQMMLEQVERANLFLVPLDEVRGWWRYHHLFADLLRSRLQQQQPDRLAELHRNAAAWSAEHGLADDAVRHAVAAGEMTWAARLVEQHVDGLILRSEGATLARWLAALPTELASSRPRLCLAQTFVAVANGDLAAAEPPLDAAERRQRCCGSHRPGGSGRVVLRPGRAERGGQDHVAVDGGGAAAPRWLHRADLRAGRLGRSGRGEGTDRRAARRHGPAGPAVRPGGPAVSRAAAATVRTILQRFAAGGGSVIFSSHVMALVERLCDHVAVIAKGTVVASGPLDEVRGGQPLEDAFVHIVGARTGGAEGLSWLAS